MCRPVPVSAGCEYTTLPCSGRFLFSSCLLEVASCEAGAVGGGVEAGGAALGRLLEILEDEEVRLDLKALIWFSR